MVQNCHNCHIVHDGSYGSGRFCNVKCARSFSSKKNRDVTNQKISEKLRGRSDYSWNKGKRLVEYQTYVCPCGKKMESSHKRKFCSRECVYKFVDWSTLHKQLYASGRERVGGGKTTWLQYKNIRVQGTYELRACKILDSWKTSGSIIDWEYTNDRIQYTWPDGTEHTYLLDFKIVNNDGTVKYVEVKGYMREHDQLKFDTAKLLGYDIEFWFHENLTKYENCGDITREASEGAL